MQTDTPQQQRKVPVVDNESIKPGAVIIGRNESALNRLIVRRVGTRVFWTPRKNDGTFDIAKEHQCCISTICEWGAGIGGHE